MGGSFAHAPRANEPLCPYRMSQLKIEQMFVIHSAQKDLRNFVYFAYCNLLWGMVYYNQTRRKALAERVTFRGCFKAGQEM